MSKNKFPDSFIYNAPIHQTAEMLTTLSFFSGVRGLDIGAKKAGFTTLFHSDIEPNAGRAFQLNIQEADGILKSNHLSSEGVFLSGKCADINNLNFMTISQHVQQQLKIKLKIKGVDVIHGGPPCQDFSKCNRKRSPHSLKNKLIFQLLRIIGEVKPKVGLIEQVPDLISSKFRVTWNMVMSTLNSMVDYVWDYKVMNAMNYGARQSRKRLIIMLVRRDLGIHPSFPNPTTPDLAKVAVQSLLPDVYHFSPGQFGDEIKCARSNIFCTMTASGSEKFYGLDGKRRELTIIERLTLTELTGLRLNGISLTHQKRLLGNMVQVSFAEALFKHIRKTILKK